MNPVMSSEVETSRYEISKANMAGFLDSAVLRSE